MKKLLLLMLLLPMQLHAEPNVLVMAYPERERNPFIAEKPADDGAYKEIFSTAADRIGMQLKIVRLPKKRIFQYMLDHKVDFYPGSYSTERDGLMNWIDFGLKLKYICLSRPDVAPIHGLENAPPLRLIHEIGDSMSRINETYPNITPVVLGPRIDMPQAIRLLTGKRGDLYMIFKPVFLHFMQSNNYSSVETFGLRYHEDCAGFSSQVLVGFSVYSRYYREEVNPNFNASMGKSATNQPMRISPGSLAGKFEEALHKMNESGEVQRIIANYSR